MGSDGKDIGIINKVNENPNDRPGSPGSFYIEINVGGILGISPKHLYIRVDQVQSVKGGELLTLRCTADEANQKYTQQPH